MIEVGIPIELENPDDFSIVKETLTRIGIASESKKTIYQTAHILHSRGNYFILHFKELFILDGRQNTITDEDIERRNLIAKLLHDWKLVTIKPEININELKRAPIGSIKILSYNDKNYWTLKAKYTIGKGKTHD